MISLVPILAAALATMPVGFLWFSPMLFATPWARLNKIHHSQLKKGPGVFPLLVSFFSSFVIALLISALITMLKTPDAGVFKLGLLLWFGFDFVPGWMRCLFDKRPLGLLLINSGHAAANVIVICWVLTLMR